VDQAPASLEASGPTAGTRRKLAGLRVAVFGLEGPGAHAAALLASWGIGSLLLVDPYPCERGNLPLTPLGPDALGLPRELAVQRALEAGGGGAPAEASRLPAVTRDSVHALARDCQLLLGCFDTGFASATHWLNSASLRWRVPAMYAQLDGRGALVGPLVLPGRTACYLCWRMRLVACAKDFSAAMAREELLARQRRPALHERAVTPALSRRVGAALAREALGELLHSGWQALAGRVLEIGEVDEIGTARPGTTAHVVLPVPECPSCGQDPPVRSHPSLAELAHARKPPGDPLRAAPSLVGAVSGVVTSLGDVRPAGDGAAAGLHLATAELANHRFLDEPSASARVCVGKGLARQEALRGALGEAVERYSGATWSPGEVTFARRGELDGPSLDPRSLVLYGSGQYPRLAYAPYADGTRLGWVAARSLVTGLRVLVPAIAVFLGYRPASPEELLCPTTSNGLAAGATLAGAVLAAAYEVLERDGFLVTWMNRLPAERVKLSGHPDPEVVRLCRAYDRLGVELRLYRLASDHPCHVLLALGVQRSGGDGPAAVVGLGCDLDPGRAARAAVLEVGQARAGVHTSAPEVRARIDRLVADPRSVTTVHDHGLLYADRRSLPAFEFLDGGGAADLDWTPPEAPDPPEEPEAPGPPEAASRLRRLTEHLGSLGADLLYVNCTPPDMAALGLHTARVLIPGFQPLHFGAGEPRLGGRRLYDLPHRLGLTPAPTTPEGLNPDPHPLT